MEQCFKLYTWQNPDWDITKEKRDPSKWSSGWDEDSWHKIEPLYKKLEGELKTLNFVWCFPIYKYWKNSEIRNLWELNVHYSKIFKILDSKIWDTMIQKALDCEQPEAINLDKLILERSEGIKKLIAGNDDNITPLVCVPLCDSIQIISNDKFSCGCGGISRKRERLPISVYEAEKFQSDERKRGGFQ